MSLHSLKRAEQACTLAVQWREGSRRQSVSLQRAGSRSVGEVMVAFLLEGYFLFLCLADRCMLAQRALWSLGRERERTSWDLFIHSSHLGDTAKKREIYKPLPKLNRMNVYTHNSSSSRC